MKKIKYIIILSALLAGIAGCKDFADEIMQGNYPRPFSPTGMEANLENLDDVTITWNQVNNAETYVLELYQNDSLQFNGSNLVETLTDILPDDMPVHFKNLQKNVKYSVRVKAINADGTESKWINYYFLTKAKEVKITEWNFSEGNLLALTEVSPFAETMQVDGLTLHAASGKTMRVVANEVSAGDYNFTHYLDLQGGGSDKSVADADKNRCVSFEVTEPCIIKVYANGGGTGRTLEAYTSTEVIGTLVVPASKSDEPALMMVNWTGGKETVYVRSQGSGIYIYLIRVSIGEVYEPSSVSTLTKLAISEGAMTPSFSPDLLQYTITVPNSTAKVDFTPTLGHAKQTINSSLTAELTGDQTIYQIEVLAEDGISSSTYVFTIVKEPISSDATLKSLDITGGGTLTPDFSPDVTEYVFNVDTTVHEVMISGTSTHPYATVGGSGITYDNLKLGNNGPFTITVISEDKSNVKTYSVTVQRVAPVNPGGNAEWNFSDAPFGEVIEYSTETTIAGLTLIPSEKTIKITANNKSMDGYNFTYRLQFQGTGDPTKNAVKFAVTGACRITVYGMAGNSSATDRPLVISDGTTELFNEVILGDALQKKVYDYNGGAGNLFIYSGNSGINLYMIKVVY
ncbi:MAG TPA: cadherin-like beta sandwich domain-containing protein [Draconibacterium sp.]|nr:cadherin-like beta sandwich domain-containing protein [Draconibacterium sp.]